MKLKKYLLFKKQSSKSFARKINVSYVSVSRYISGSRVPAKNIIEKIFRITDGLVSANDFLIEEKNENYEFKFNNSEIEELQSNIKKGSRKFLAKAITLVESTKLEDQRKSETLLSKLPKNNNTIRIGISGVPGVGKSTFIESLGLFLIDMGLKVSVLAIDPSSQKTGGSILGDKTRMEKLSTNNSAFIRPSPSSGHLGGVAKTTRESMLCVEASGYEIVFIETMGVGQAETSVYNMVDIFLVLLLPSGGDDLQGIKKGIIELADLLIVNKADDNLISAANITVNDYMNALSIIKPIRSNWRPKVMKCSSIKNQGIREIWELITNYIKVRKENNSFLENRSEQNTFWMWEIIDNKISNFINNKAKKEDFIRKIETDVYKQEIDPSYGANLILKNYLKNYN